MLPPKTPSQGAKHQSRALSSKTVKNTSKARCEAWTPLNAWEQSDRAEEDIFYLAIDSWAKRNSKITPDAPKGVPSSKIWEPFLCTTIDQCKGIADFEAFCNVSLRLHRYIETERELSRDDEGKPETNSEKPGAKLTKHPDADMTESEKPIEDRDETATPEREKENERKDFRQSNGEDNPSSKSVTDGPEVEIEQEGNGKGSMSETGLGQPTEDPASMDGSLSNDHGDVDTSVRTSRINSSRSAPVLRTQAKAPTSRRTGSAKSRTADDKLRKTALRNATSKSRGPAQKVSVSANPVKISYSHSSDGRSGIFAGNLPAKETVDIGITEEDHNGSPENGASGRSTAERRLLIEEALLDSRKVDYMAKTSHVSIGDLLSSSPRLERRLGNSNGSGVRSGGAYPGPANGEEVTSSTESFGGRWPSRSPRHHDDASSPSNESSLPPVPTGSMNGDRNILTSPATSQQQDGGRSGGRLTVGLGTARIPVISYSTKLSRRDTEELRDAGDVGQEKTHVPEDTRYIKYNESIMNAIQETTMELDAELTNRLLKTTLARERHRVHSADYVRQRGPPGFRPHNLKTPLQRAVENAHKKIYGQHYHLFNGNSSNNSGIAGMENGEDGRGGVDSAGGHRSQSASGEFQSAFVWKESVESQIKHKRKTSYSGLDRARLKSRSNVNVSDFHPKFKTDVLKTDRRQITKR